MAWRRHGAGRREPRRERRRRTVRLLRAQGRYGPEFREVLPALSCLVVAVCLTVAGAASAYRVLGAGAPLVVHRGTFSVRDVRWARRQGGTRLLDGALLHRWAHGTPLHHLIDLS
ncbi:hypothetical protein [Streptomyces sp. NPDC086766]|uniref:hypothetical protein n=1 Tax=Streptomyces sp. NPDC086766 TaxID=3365754 RepID=UPI0037F80114